MNHKWHASGTQVLKSMELNGATREACKEAALEAWSAQTNVQLFKMVNHGLLYTNSGAYSTSSFGQLCSPFTSGQFVRTALRLDRDIVKGQRAYLTWIMDRFPEATHHVWERYNANTEALFMAFIDGKSLTTSASNEGKCCNNGDNWRNVSL